MPPVDPNRDVREVMEEWFQPTHGERLRIEESAAAIEIGSLLYKMRTEAGLTEEELAEKVGVSRSTIDCIESAQCRDGSLGLLRQVAYVLGKEVHIELRDRACAEKSEATRELEPA